jgi:hypothetical protein
VADRIDTSDVHLVRQGQAVVPRTQKFTAEILASSSRLRLGGDGIVHPGQVAPHSAPSDHVQDAIRSPAAEVIFQASGPGQLRAGGNLVVTLAGQVRLCCDFSPLRPCGSALRKGRETKLRVGGAVCVVGRVL